LGKILGERYPSTRNATNATLVLGTQFMTVGGHSRIARDLSIFSDKYFVIATDVANSYRVGDPGSLALSDFFAPSRLDFAPAGGLYEKLIWVLSKIREIQPRTLVLLNHFWDPIPIVAASTFCSSQVIYIHHCDHNPSLGASITSFNHFDTTPHSQRICGECLGRNDIRVYPLHDTRIERFEPMYADEAPLSTLSAGTSNKYSFDQSAAAYHLAIPKFLQATGGYHHHIGPLSGSELLSINEALRIHGIEASRFIYWGAASLSRVAKEVINPVFIPSFPTPGGMSLIEFAASGIPILVYDVDSSAGGLPLIRDSLFSILPEAALRCRLGEDLVDFFYRIKANYSSISLEISRYYESSFSRKSYLRAFSDFFG